MDEKLMELLQRLDGRGKRNEIRNERLDRELNKIKQVERSHIRMLETVRHRFRSKLKRFKVPHLSSGFDATNVRMYETHHPGFCYHSNGVMKAYETSRGKKFIDLFDVVCTMIFTDGQIDPDKVLCLHLLAAHYAKSGYNESSEIRPITPLIDRGKKENFYGSWNSILPCYVLDIQQNVNELTNFSDEMKLHKDPFVVEAEEEIVKDFLCKYEEFIQENSDVGLALLTNNKRTKIVPNGIGKTIIIPPHIYSLLGAAQELKIKQAIAEESRRKKFRRSNSSVKNVDDRSMSFRLQDDDDDTVSHRLINSTSIRGWNGSKIIGPSKISGLRSNSKKSVTSSNKNDLSVTTLKPVSPRSNDLNPLSKDVSIDTHIVTIKPSDRTMGSVISKTWSTKSPFRNFSSAHSPGSLYSNSIVSGISGSFSGETRPILRPIFINYPIETLSLRNRGYKTVPILVNNQMQALVHSVMEILEQVNPIKMQKIISTAKNPYEIRKMLIRPDIQNFIETLVGQPLISSPNSFVISIASIVHEIDPRVENSVEKELVATTLAVPPTPGLHRLVEEIRNNLFVDPKEIIGLREDMKVQSFGYQKQKLLDSKIFPKDITDVDKNIFDVKTSCSHLDIQETKLTCASCYAKWKNSLSDTERLKVPDFSFVLVNNGNKITTKYENNPCQLNSEKDKESPDVPLDLYKNLEKGAISKTCRSSKGFSSKKVFQQPSTSLYSVSRKSRLNQKYITSDNNSVRNREKFLKQNMKTDQTNEAQSYKGSKSIVTDCETVIGTSLQKRCSRISLRDDAPSPKCQFKPWKASQNPGYLEPDSIILRRMSNPQRILVGQMCASLKTRKINLEGIVKEKMPLAALIAPVLSYEELRILTKGTRQAKSRIREMIKEDDDSVTIVSEELTGPVLAKIRQAIAENETKRRLKSFLKSKI